jgi:hypothetical protein
MGKHQIFRIPYEFSKYGMGIEAFFTCLGFASLHSHRGRLMQHFDESEAVNFASWSIAI